MPPDLFFFTLTTVEVRMHELNRTHAASNRNTVLKRFM